MKIYVDETEQQNIWYAVRDTDADWFTHTTNITLNEIILPYEADNIELYRDIIRTAEQRDRFNNTKYYLSPAGNPVEREGWMEVSLWQILNTL